MTTLGFDEHDESYIEDAYDDFYQQFEDVLDEKILEKMKRSIDAPLRGMFNSNHRPEWLHGYGFGLTPEKLPFLKCSSA